MIFKKKYLVVLSVLLGACGCNGPASPVSRVPREPQKPAYVGSEVFKTVRPDPPPAAGSEAQKADLAAVLELQQKRTEADCARARASADVDYDFLFGGNNPFPAPLPGELNRFFRRLDRDIGEFMDAMKNKFSRPRPFLASKEVRPCVKPGSGYSYPSGHSLYSRIYADVLGDILPSRKVEFVKRSDEAGLDRVLGGVHYPTDAAAGNVLGDEFHARLLKSPAYLRDIEKLKALLVK